MYGTFSFWQQLLATSSDFVSRRATRRLELAPGKTVRLLDLRAAGCIRRWWIGCPRPDDDTPVGRSLTLRIRTDEAGPPDVEMPLDAFFGVMLARQPYPVNTPCLTVVPGNGVTCYLPIPFARSCVLELTSRAREPLSVHFMADWQQLPEGAAPPYRLHAEFRHQEPAPSYGSYAAGSAHGRGFVAGLTLGVRPRETGDCWYHTGGDLWLIDGETDPHVLRGIGAGHTFGLSGGLEPFDTPWMGVPCCNVDPPGPDPTGVREVAAYRFFGPDPIAFRSSIVCRLGSRANDMKSVLYYYLHSEEEGPPPARPLDWELIGPFECGTLEQFDRGEFPENNEVTWPTEVVARFGPYAEEHGGPRVFRPTHTRSEHTWVDLAAHFRGLARGDAGTQPANVSAYADCALTCADAGRRRVRIGFDDWLKLWLNGKLVLNARHDRGFAVETTDPLPFRAGANKVLVKLSNADNEEWRTWAFSFNVLPNHEAHEEHEEGPK